LRPPGRHLVAIAIEGDHGFAPSIPGSCDASLAFKIKVRDVGILELLWQAGKDRATMLVMQAADAECKGDAVTVAALQEAAEVLDAQAEQDMATIEYIRGQ
jgi:hypothetical protein